MYKLYGGITAAGTTDSVVTLDIREDDTIDEVYIEVLNPGPTDGQVFGASLSFSSTSGHVTNDTTQEIAGIYGCWDLVTSGAGAARVSERFQCGIKVAAGERLHMHIYSSTTGTLQCRIWICTKKGQTRDLTRYRR